MSAVSFVYDLVTVKSLIGDPLNCLKCVKNSRQLALPSKCIGNLGQGVNNILMRKVKQFSERLNGIIIAYEKVRIGQRYASIVNDLPYVLVEAEADFYVFHPEIGSTLLGTVNKVGHDFFGCLVHNCFNVSVLSKDDEDYWNKPNVEIGSKVLLEVLALDLHSKVIYIKGKLLEVLDAPKNDVDISSDQTSPKKKRKDKKAEKVPSVMKPKLDHAESMVGSISHKKVKIEPETSSSEDDSSDEDDESKKKTKVKRKKKGVKESAKSKNRKSKHNAELKAIEVKSEPLSSSDTEVKSFKSKKRKSKRDGSKDVGNAKSNIKVKSELLSSERKKAKWNLSSVDDFDVSGSNHKSKKKKSRKIKEEPVSIDTTWANDGSLNVFSSKVVGKDKKSKTKVKSELLSTSSESTSSDRKKLNSQPGVTSVEVSNIIGSDHKSKKKKSRKVKEEPISIIESTEKWSLDTGSSKGKKRKLDEILSEGDFSGTKSKKSKKSKLDGSVVKAESESSAVKGNSKKSKKTSKKHKKSKKKKKKSS